jgi:hypothetical protein
MRDQEILGLYESYNQIIAKEIELEEKSGSSRPTKLSLSRERNIGNHDDWKDITSTDWNDRPPAAKKLAARARQVVGTQERQDREAGLREEEVDIYDVILSHLLDEGYADTEESATVIMVNMSEEWMQSIVEETKRTKYLQNKFNKENENKPGSALKHIPGKQNTGQALQNARKSERNMRGDK